MYYTINYKLHLQSKGSTAPSLPIRKVNIDFCAGLDRLGLGFNTLERQLLLFTSKYGEDIYIQYPGKETISKSPKPWDFRPKLLMNTGYYLKDLSFGDIWDALFEVFSHLPNRNALLKLLAIELYRIAFMLDYTPLPSNHTYFIRDFDLTKVLFSPPFPYVSPNSLYVYTPCKEIIDILTSHVPTILGVSWEAFFMYNDLLAFNEDCKYFYRAKYKSPTPLSDTEALQAISSGTGRINTLLTHINAIGFILGEVKFSNILYQATSTGVAPVSNNAQLKRILYPYL